MENKTRTNEGTGLPRVSIIIPVYNGSNYMREAIDSALNQSYENVEIIVVNDGSTDGGKTAEIAESYGDRIRYIYKPNGGVSSALNMGIRHMTGEYFSWLSHDDVYERDKVKHQIEWIQDESAQTILLCGSRHIDEKGNPIDNARKHLRFSEDCKLSWQEAIIALLRQGSFNGCAFLIPKSVFEKCGCFHEDLRYSQDTLMWLTIFLSKYNLVYRNQYDVCCRIHNAQLTQTGRSIFYSDSLTVAEIVLSKLLKESTKEHNLLYFFARNNAIYNNQSVVKRCLLMAEPVGIFSFTQKVVLHIYSIYGAIRPAIRRVYYRLFKKVKTQ